MSRSSGATLATPNEIGFAEITSGSPPNPFVNSIAAGGIAIPGLSITVPVGARPIEIEIDGNIQAATANPTFGTVFLLEDGTIIDLRNFQMAAASFQSIPFKMSKRRAPSAGNHTYAVYGRTATATNTWWFTATLTPPVQTASIRAIQA